MDYNYHTHTYKCGHARGTIEEYIVRAIENGIKYMGFSDHIPYKCKGGFEANHRVPLDQAKAYYDEIDELRKKYKDQIDIKIGFETEYYSEDFDEMLKNAIKFGAEYLIVGEHYTEDESSGTPHAICATDSVERLKKYASAVMEAMETGYITYIAHPDLFNFTGEQDIYEAEMRRICEASKKYDVPLEINFLGIYEGRNYPNKTFWKIAGECQAPVTFGFDAHDAYRAFDDASLKIAEGMVKEYGLNYIGRPKIRHLQCD